MIHCRQCLAFPRHSAHGAGFPLSSDLDPQAADRHLGQDLEAAPFRNAQGLDAPAWVSWALAQAWAITWIRTPFAG